MFLARLRLLICLCSVILCSHPAPAADAPSGNTAQQIQARPEFQLQSEELASEALEQVFASQLRMFEAAFGARFMLEGHEVRTLTPGPDGRLYFICSDSGAAIQRREGGVVHVPEEGAVLRCEPDGSHLEIYCRGVRDPHGMAFDNVGNLFTSDEGSGKDEEGRWLNLVEHGDYGWRTGWPRAGLGPARTPWIAERLWAARFDGQAAWVLPSAFNVATGSQGLTHYPGTGLSPRYEDHFFVCNPLRQAIFSWQVKSNGAGFLLLDQVKVVEQCAAYHVAFGPDDKVYFTTQEDSLKSKNSTRFFTLSPAGALPDPQVEEVRQLLGDGLPQKLPIELRQLLKHPDQRVRLAAEWRLAVAPDGENPLRDVALSPVVGPEPTVARLHAIWGLGIMARRAEEKSPGAGVKILEPLVPLLEDEDLEVRAQAAKVLGELGIGAAFDGLIKALRSPEERVSMFAAEALAKLARPEMLPQLLLMVRDAGDHDPYLRHAYVDALLGLNDFSAIGQAARDGSPTVRMVALLAMRERKHPEIAQFLHDEEPALVVEAARAINDKNIAEALPQLAALIEKPSADEALMCRVLNANFKLGQPSNATALASIAVSKDLPEALRGDAKNLLGAWAHPPPYDYVTGTPQSLADRDPKIAQDALAAAAK